MSRFRSGTGGNSSRPVTEAAFGTKTATTGVAAIPPVANGPISRANSTLFQRFDLGSGLQRMALWFACIFVFVRFSYLHEILAVTLNLRSYLLPIFQFPALVGLVMTGGFMRVFKTRSSLYFCLFVGWLIVAVPFSHWRGGSLEEVSVYLRTQFPLFLLVIGLVIQLSELRWMLYAIAIAGAVNLWGAQSLRTGTDRLSVERVTFGNANDLAAQLLFILPIFGYIIFGSRLPKLIRLLCIPIALYSVYCILLSASRGAVVALLALWVLSLIFTSGIRRMFIAILLPLSLLVVLVVLPGEVMRRLASVVDDDASSTEAAGARSSTEGRRYLLMRSLELTIRNPIWGVGPGQFSSTEGGEAQSQGQRGVWMQTHNMFTQVSSEAGLPALLLFVLAIGSGFRLCIKIRREAQIRGDSDLALLALTVLAIGVAFCTAAFFLSLAYRFLIPALIGLMSGLHLAAHNEWARAPVTSPGAPRVKA